MELNAHSDREQALEILEPVSVVTDATLRMTATRIMLGCSRFPWWRPSASFSFTEAAILIIRNGF